MIDYLRCAVMTLVSSVITMFSPIRDVMIGMIILLSVNALFGLVADIIDGNGFCMRKALSFLGQCFVFFGLVTSLFAIGHFIHKHNEAVTCVSLVSIITTWVFAVNILRNCKECVPNKSPMYKLFDILHYIVSVQVIERIPYVANYMTDRKKDSEC